MSIKEGQDQKRTDSTRFLLRGLGILPNAIDNYGFLNAFLDDIDHETHYENCVYLLFKPKELSLFEWFVEEEKSRTNLLVEEYDYPNGFVVLVYKFPAEYMENYRLFKEGKYSKFTEKYKKLFPMEKSGISSKNIPVKEPSFYYHIFKKSDTMKAYWENKLGVILDEDSEYWSIPNMQKETLNINKYE